MIIDEEQYSLKHYGMPRRSGRYPWGSGKNPQRSLDFLAEVERLKRQGLSEKQIAEGMGLESITELRNLRTIANNAKKAADISQAQRLKETGMSNIAIGKEMGIPESSVRALLAPGADYKIREMEATAQLLKDQVAKKGYIDVGDGVEQHLDMSKEKLATVLTQLKSEGYVVEKVQVDQAGTSNKTTLKVLAPPETSYVDIKKNLDQVNQLDQVMILSDDGSRSLLGLQTPISVDSKRVQVNYKEDGGENADGVIYVRPGVEDISIGNARYAQVRIAVDGTHYLKGMAIYKDDLPKGVDLVFNTNKSDTGNKLDAMKEMEKNKLTGEIDQDNPFGAMVRQRIDPATGKVTSAMNIVGLKEGSGEEGAWDTWSKTLSSQFLSKQKPSLAKEQLDMTYERKRSELDEIKQLTNPAVKRTLLEAFADSADSSAVHLKAAALPRQATKVILPVNSLKDNEVYAPTFRDGEMVALVRFPHGGKFEIPELRVNNRHPEAKQLLGRAEDAIGINKRVADRLSGADFDGDTVLVIPNNNRKVQSDPPLQALKNFDAKAQYPAYEGMKVMDARTKQREMGVVSNLITDMTIGGASNDELARAVKHSMVVIDAEKHKLNYKQSALDNGIPALMEKYQGKKTGGASTVISKSGANATTRVPEYKVHIDPATGRKIKTPTGATYIQRTTKKDGTVVEKVVPKLTKVPNLEYVDDARKFLSGGGVGQPVERVYADHSNRMKALANEARREGLATKNTPYSPSAKVAYAKEVGALDTKLALAIRNRPLERQAQVLADSTYRGRLKADPTMDNSTKKKIRAQALQEARARVGAKKPLINITDTEWDAIQAGAITNHKLEQILRNADLDQVKQLATPKSAVLMSPAKVSRARSMQAAGYTQAEIADALGVSVTTLQKGLK